jgi:hypothetical protein
MTEEFGFDAGTVVKPLKWTFVAITHDEADQGIVPEPTDEAIEQMFKDVAGLSRELMKKAGLGDGEATPEQLMIALADLPEDAEIGITDMLKGMTRIFAKLCRNQPNATQLNKLPMRIRMRFFVWLAGELRPEDFGAATMNRTPVTPNLRIAKGA